MVWGGGERSGGERGSKTCGFKSSWQNRKDVADILGWVKTLRIHAKRPKLNMANNLLLKNLTARWLQPLGIGGNQFFVCCRPPLNAGVTAHEVDWRRGRGGERKTGPPLPTSRNGPMLAVPSFFCIPTDAHTHKHTRSCISFIRGQTQSGGPGERIPGFLRRAPLYVCVCVHCALQRPVGRGLSHCPGTSNLQIEPPSSWVRPMIQP